MGRWKVDESQDRAALRPDPGRLAWIDIFAVLVGGGLGLILVRAGLRTASTGLRLDADIAMMVALLLAPAGIAIVSTLYLLLATRFRTWSWGTWLVPVSCMAGLGWTEVMLDNGLKLGALAKFLGGTSALLLSPLAAAIAVGVGAWSLRNGAMSQAWHHWLGITLGLACGVGWIAFLRVMLPLTF